MSPQTRILKKKTLSIMATLSILTSLALISMPVQASPVVRVFVDMPLGYIPGVPPGPLPGSLVFVDLYIDTDIPDNTPPGIVQWAVSVQVDPTVLEPMGVQGGPLSGYFLNDFLVRYGYNYMGYSVSLLPPIIDKGAGIMQWISEAIIGDPPIAVGAGEVPGQMPYKLCTLVLQSLSETEYSPIDLFYEVGVDVWYWTGESGQVGFPADVVGDGIYNLPLGAVVFETPPGGMFPTGDPIGTDWHELEPVFCQDWSLESWEDNGDGHLSPSDQIDMALSPTGAISWFHVEWVNPNPAPGDGIADMVGFAKDVPEFPLGSVAPIALIAAVAYIWWVTRRKKRAL